MKVKIKHITSNNWHHVAKIYKLGIETGMATFETEIPSWEQWNLSHLESCRIAAYIENEIVGWTALSPVSKRSVYKGVAEVSVYVDINHVNRGIGTQLLETLISQSEKQGVWTLQASIFRENEASIQLHKKAGFRVIGYKEKIGKINNVWFDNILLERRSNIIGIN